MASRAVARSLVPALRDRVRQMDLHEPVVVAPDAGFVKKARKYAAYLEPRTRVAGRERGV